MNLFSKLRFIVLARRAVVALERLADAHRDIAQVYTDEWRTKHARAKPRPTEFGQVDLAAAEKSWTDRLEEELRES